VFNKIVVESEICNIKNNQVENLSDENLDAKSGYTEKKATEIEGKGRTEVEVLLADNLESPDVPQHTFEKVETLEEFEGHSLSRMGSYSKKTQGKLVLDTRD